MFERKIRIALWKPLNRLIITISIILSFLSSSYETARYPIVLGLILVLFSTLYYYLFIIDKEQSLNNQNNKTHNIIELLTHRQDRLNPILTKIISSLYNLKKLDQYKFQAIADKMYEIIEFEKIIPAIVESYRKASDFTNCREDVISSEIIKLEKRLSETTNKSVQQSISNAIFQKKETREEIYAMLHYMEECESNLEYIFSCLENIETTIENAGISEHLTINIQEKIQEQFKVFTNAIRNISNKLL